jgi:hypothetical protein
MAVASVWTSFDAGLMRMNSKFPRNSKQPILVPRRLTTQFDVELTRSRRESMSPIVAMYVPKPAEHHAMRGKGTMPSKWKKILDHLISFAIGMTIYAFVFRGCD